MRSLVLYFTMTNNTKTVAEEIAKQMKADIKEIKPIEAYKKDYQALMTRGIKEIKKGIKPAIYDINIDIEKYDMIFIGSPNWMNTFAPPIATFIEKYDIENKIIVPFVTYDQGDAGQMDEHMKKAYTKCRVIDAIKIEGNGGENLSHDLEIIIARKNLHNLNMPVKN